MRERLLMALLAGLIVAAGCSRFKAFEPGYASEKTAEDLEFDAAVDRKPSAWTLYAMARILAIRGQDAKCRIVLTRILREYPGFMPAYCDLAELHMRQGRPNSALATLAEALRVKPVDPVILNNMGMCHLEKDQCPQALKRFTEAASVTAASARYRANMAIALGLMGRYAESLALYRQVLPEDHAHLNLAILCQARKDFTRAQKEFQRAETIARQRELMAAAHVRAD